MSHSPPETTPATAASGMQVESTIVIFGASGDLTARKLIPALYELSKAGFLSPRSPIIGVARREKSHETFRKELHTAVKQFARGGIGQAGQWQKFAQQLFYCQIDIADAAQYADLERQIAKIEQANGVPNKRVIYMATTPDLFVPAAEALAQAGMIPPSDSDDKLRIVFEKPFGTDLESARELNRTLGRLLREEQIYRIDHYLGKETVQNILMFRFGNAIFEPLFNRNHVDHVQITVSESQGMEHGRGGYYDKSGALRDVLQNHVLQLLCLVAMEPPAQFRAKEIRDEKVKVLQCLAPADRNALENWAIAGQYIAGQINGQTAASYREEDRISPTSARETYVAMDVRIDNWRWAGVPFLLRTGKRLPARVTEIAIQFKLPPLHLFTTVECEGDLCDLVAARPNRLIFRIQPHEAISLQVCTKRPGIGMNYQIHPVEMDFEFEDAFHSGLPEAYERLLLDVMRGDSTLFTRSDELDAAWKFVTPVLQAWETPGFEPEFYPAGSWGPAAADDLIGRCGATWRRPRED